MKELDEMKNCDHNFIEERGRGKNRNNVRIICAKCRLPEEVFKVQNE